MTRFELSTPGSRLWTYLHHVWSDHAYLRLAFSNAHWISDEMVRTNQPWPFQLKAWRDRGVKTIVNLRGEQESDSHYVLEREACERLGLKLVTFTVTSREPPTAERVAGAKRLFETLEYPALMHCKSGADRAGIMGVLYLHFRRGLPIGQAVEQLHPRYLHVKAGLTGVLDRVFELYLAQAEPKGISFLDWTQSPAYDPDRINREYRAKWWGTLLTERLLRRE
ncbi:MAG: tyrosine-protein phosphatase [Caulobacterales bacterium]